MMKLLLLLLVYLCLGLWVQIDMSLSMHAAVSLWVAVEMAVR